MMDNYSLVIDGIAYTTVYMIIMVAMAVRIFDSDRLLTASVQKMVRRKLMWGFSAIINQPD